MDDAVALKNLNFSWQTLLARFGIYHLRPRRSGVIYTLCIFHQERTPSLVLYPNNQTYHCYGCQRSGHAVKFVRQLVGCGQERAITLIMHAHATSSSEAQLVLPGID
ncbi:hypothetical protein KBC55_01650 [Patescibacteria group bacterium]|nr:hypothetical protein [Patescibacteria group bacterium]